MKERVYLQVECNLDTTNPDGKTTPFLTPEGARDTIYQFLHSRSPHRDWEVSVMDHKAVLANSVSTDTGDMGALVKAVETLRAAGMLAPVTVHNHVHFDTSESADEEPAT